MPIIGIELTMEYWVEHIKTAKVSDFRFLHPANTETQGQFIEVLKSCGLPAILDSVCDIGHENYCHLLHARVIAATDDTKKTRSNWGMKKHIKTLNMCLTNIILF